MAPYSKQFDSQFDSARSAEWLITTVGPKPKKKKKKEKRKKKSEKRLSLNKEQGTKRKKIPPGEAGLLP